MYKYTYIHVYMYTYIRMSTQCICSAGRSCQDALSSRRPPSSRRLFLLSAGAWRLRRRGQY